MAEVSLGWFLDFFAVVSLGPASLAREAAAAAISRL